MNRHKRALQIFILYEFVSLGVVNFDTRCENNNVVNFDTRCAPFREALEDLEETSASQRRRLVSGAENKNSFLWRYERWMNGGEMCFIQYCALQCQSFHKGWRCNCSEHIIKLEQWTPTKNICGQRWDFVPTGKTPALHPEKTKNDFLDISSESLF